MKYWCIGNEMWNVWSWGFMEVRYYVKKHNMTVAAMRAADPGIVALASTRFGSMHLRQDSRKEVAWNDMIVEDCLDQMNYMAEHFYVNEKTDLKEHIGQGAAEVRRIAEQFRALREKYPRLKQSPVRVAMTEWNVGYSPDIPGCGMLAYQNPLKNGLLIATALHEYFRQSDAYFMANMAQTVNVIGAIKATKTAAWLETTGLAMVMYRRYYGTLPLAVSGDFTPLDVAAALTSDGKTLTLGVVNPTSDNQTLRLEPDGMTLAGGGRRHWFGGESDPMVYNNPQTPRRVILQEKEVETARRCRLSLTVQRYLCSR